MIGWKTLRQPVHPRVPVRWSTVLMAVAFVGLGALYLHVRTEPPQKVVVGVSTETTAHPTTTTTEPESTTATAPPTTAAHSTTTSSTSTTTPRAATTTTSTAGATASTGANTATSAP